MLQAGGSSSSHTNVLGGPVPPALCL